MRWNDGRWKAVTPDRLPWKLHAGENEFDVRSRNLFGELGPVLRAVVTWQPREKLPPPTSR